MEVKKNPEADIDRKKPALFMLGGVAALAMILSLGEYTSAEVTYSQEKKLDKKKLDIEEVMEMPNSTPPPPPPPPPPVLFTNVEVTKDEKLVNEDVVVINNEDNDDVVVVEIPDKKEEIIVDEIFDVVEEQPEYPGGIQELYAFIGKNFEYPEMAKAAGVQGKVYVQFVVGKDGSILEVKVLRGLGSGLDEEAARVVKMMPKWKPGKQRGKEVKVRYNLPIVCKLK
jgi:periplasmic protein TonB